MSRETILFAHQPILHMAPGRHIPHHLEYGLVKELIGIAAMYMFYTTEP